ncbi:hypothetical protein JKP88DRAFT_174798, partial [Tribonema minus]
MPRQQQRWRLACLAGAALLGAASAQTIRGFTANKPIVPSKDPDLVVELVWQFVQPAGNLDQPTQIKWLPGTEQVVTSHKTGTMRLYDSIDAGVEDFIPFANNQLDVDSEGDHGLLSFQFHPDFNVKAGVGSKYIFLLYSGNPKDVTLLPNNDVVAAVRPPTWGAGPPDPKGYTWGDGPCPDLGKDNMDGLICEKVYYLDRYTYDPATRTAAKDMQLMEVMCGTSSTHGTGELVLVGKDMVFAVGDGAQFVVFDPGFPTLNACYVPGNGKDQGVFNAQRDDMLNGKVIKVPYAALDAAAPLTPADISFISRGSRQPLR